MRQGHDLRYVSRVFEDDHVMGIETYGSMVFSSMKQILNDVHDTDVSNIKHMMTPIPDRILWCYGENQTLYGTVDGVDFQQGLPDLDTLDPRIHLSGFLIEACNGH
jgi:hypothetical protein